MEKIVLIFIFVLICQSSQFSTGHGDGELDEASLPGLHSQAQGGQFIENTDTDIGKQKQIADAEDISEEKQDDKEMKFNSISGDYYPDYEEYLSQHFYHGGL